MNDDFYEKLRQRLSVLDGHILTYDEVMGWPEGKLDELMREGKVREGQPSETIVCIECPERCPIVPDIREHPDTGELLGVYICPHDEDIGRFMVDLNRRKRWEIADITPMKKKRRKKKRVIVQKTKAETVFKPWDKKNRTCFICDSGKIRFFYQDENKEIPFRKGTDAPLVLAAFQDRTLTGKEIQELTDSKSPPSQIVRNINRTINIQLRKIGFEDIQGIAFLKLNDEHQIYELFPKIVAKKDIEKVM